MRPRAGRERDQLPREPNTPDLYLAHRGELLDYASKIVGDRGQAEDVVQEAYLRFDAALAERGIAEPLSYLFRIVRNLSLDLRRRLGRERVRLTPIAADAADELVESRPSPEADAAGRQELRLVAAALAELPERTRTALEMHRFGGHTVREIAVHLGISVGTAHTLLVQGLEHCRSRLYRR